MNKINHEYIFKIQEGIIKPDEKKEGWEDKRNIK